MKRRFAILILATLALSIVSCGKEHVTEQEPVTEDKPEQVTENDAFKIYYDLGDTSDVFTDMPASAKSGDEVEIRTGVIFDTDIHVYANGNEIEKTHFDSDYWGYSFVMPESDVMITARFYSKAEVNGEYTDRQAVLMEKYPEYFALDTFKGLEVYFWQFSANSYSFGVMSGTNINKTLEQLLHLRGVSADDMREILAFYDIPDDYISVIPFSNPISSFIPEYSIRMEGEDDEAYRKKREAYITRVREMLGLE